MTARRVVAIAVGVLVVVVVVLQVVPAPRPNNPPVESAAVWPNEQVRALATRACVDCHSYETNWPWYSYVAPMSWLVVRDVEEGRDDFNFSTWDDDADDVDDAIETIEEGEMPPPQYTIVHRSARLSDAEVEVLIDGLRQMGRS